MKTIEKAEELYSKYYQQVADGSYPEYNAKQCALIAVDEILKHIEISYFNEHIIEGAKKYWEEVKQEIEKYGGQDEKML